MTGKTYKHIPFFIFAEMKNEFLRNKKLKNIYSPKIIKIVENFTGGSQKVVNTPNRILLEFFKNI